MPALLRWTAILWLGLLPPALALAGTAPEVMAEGQPPLTRQMLRELDGFISWLLETPLTAEQQEKLEGSVIQDWRTHDADGMKGILDSLQVNAQLTQLPEGQRELVRQKLLPEVLSELKKEQAKDEAARWMLAIYRASHRPIARGTPPLTRQMSDGYVEVLFFMMSQVSGQPLVANAELKAAWARSLASDYGKMTPSSKKQLANMPLLAAALRVAWPKLSEEEREGYRKSWRGILESMWRALPSPATPAQDRDGKSPAAKNETFEEAMRQTQRQHELFMSMSRMSMETHYTTMNAINTLGGNPYRYVNAYGNPY